MKDRLLLLAYLVVVVLVTLVHAPAWLAAGVALALALSGRSAGRLLRRALLAVLVFNAAVSLSYAAVAGVQGTFSAHYLLLVNLRVLLLTLLTLLLAERVNAYRALGFSRDLGYLLVLAGSQLVSLRRLLEEFRLALRSRGLGRVSWRTRHRQAGVLGAWLLEKSLVRSREVNEAMRSRGFFDG